MEITYTSDQPRDWNKALDAAETLDKLKAIATEWELVAWDAKDIIDKMTPKSFAYWRRGLKKERQQQFAGWEFARKCGAILIPETMMKVSLVAAKFFVPWGCAYIRCREEGVIEEVNGRAQWRGR